MYTVYGIKDTKKNNFVWIGYFSKELKVVEEWFNQHTDYYEKTGTAYVGFGDSKTKIFSWLSDNKNNTEFVSFGTPLIESQAQELKDKCLQKFDPALNVFTKKTQRFNPVNYCQKTKKFFLDNGVDLEFEKNPKAQVNEWNKGQSCWIIAQEKIIETKIKFKNAKGTMFNVTDFKQQFSADQLFNKQQLESYIGA